MHLIKSFLKKNFSSLAFFYHYLRYRIPLLLAVSILVGLMDGLGLAMFLPMLQMVADSGATATAEQMGKLAFVVEAIEGMGLELTLTVVLGTILVFFTLKGAFRWLEAFLRVVFQQYFIRRIREENIEALANYRYEAFVQADAGRIQNTLSGEIQRVAGAYRNYSQMLQQVVMVLTYTGLAFLSNPQFAALVAAGGFLSNLLFNILYKKTKRLSAELTKRNHGFQGLLIQQVAFFKYLKATGRIRSYARKLREKVQEIERTNRQIGVLGSIVQGVREPLMIGVVVAVILIQIKLMGGSLGLIILSILFFYRALNSVMQLQQFYNLFLTFSGSLSNLTGFAQELQKDRERAGKKQFEGFREVLELRNVSFAYQQTPVLQGIKLELHRNETLALVGESGSGKTTLMNLMSGLLRPTEGEVLIDGVNLRSLNTASFQQRIGYITQEPVIFNDTVFNNVTFWDEKTPQALARFEEALRKASILPFVMEQPQREDAQLGNNGINLSGGQKQRISIARELYKEVDFLFMDEATSALDSETERAIQQNIEQLRGKFTILIIAHRLSTIKNADRVVVLKEGRIEKIGNYQSLMANSFSFKKMVELQEL